MDQKEAEAQKAAEELDKMIERVVAAQKEYASFTQEQVDRIFHHAAAAAVAHRIDLARMAVRETGMGLMEDKVTKNHFAAEYIYHKYKDEKTCGIIEDDPVNGYREIAAPLGVVAGIIPCTNPTSTAIFKALLCLKTRNGIIFSPHPRAPECTRAAAEIIRKAAVEAGAPEHIIDCIEKPSLALSQQLMGHKGIALILATGGPGMVKAAYSSGTPAIGVGSGNTPVIIDERADIRMAVNSILLSKTFDNGMICASEQSVVCLDEVYDKVRQEFLWRGAWFADKEQAEALCGVIFKNGKVNSAIVGQPAYKIAAMAGITLPESVKVLIAERDEVRPDDPFGHEKLSPVLGMYRVPDFTAALDTAKRLILQGGAGHTSVLYTDESKRDRIDVFSDRESKCSHSVELAKSNYAASKAAYEVRLEAPDTREMELRARHQRTAQVVLSIALPLMFVGSGVPLVVHGREISSLSFTALGLGLVAMAVFLAAGALVMLFRPSKEQEARKAELQSAQWVMLQDKKKYESCLAEQEALSRGIRAFLESRGLGEASSNLRRARTILDEAKDARGDMALLQQRSQALTARLTSLEEKIARNVDALASAYTQAHLPSENATLAALDAKIARKVSQRTNLMEAFESTNRAYGELKQELATARGEHTLDEVRMTYQQIRTRYNESLQTFARLLLARRMLEMAISSWESKSQPEVYAQASELMSLMTEGRWVRVYMTADGHLRVVDSVHTERDPVHLSLGTCQQLYLSLRIALLLAADNVGRAIPILADDILVNFDSRRRRGAARALAELAKTRQVIMFTCHEEVVSVLREVSDATNVIELAM